MIHGSVLVLIGPQGSGKGTQAALLADKHGFTVIEMGALLRAEAAKKTDLANTINGILNRGDLVPVEITIQLVSQKLTGLSVDSKIVFDGFPRSIEQALALAKLIPVTKAVQIDLPYEVSIKRVSGRLLCAHGHYYNQYYLPPRVPGICNVDKLPLMQREDDTETAVRHRLELYREVTTKVLSYFSEQGKLITIDGDASVFKVAHDIETKVLTQL